MRVAVAVGRSQQALRTRQCASTQLRHCNRVADQTKTATTHPTDSNSYRYFRTKMRTSTKPILAFSQEIRNDQSPLAPASATISVQIFVNGINFKTKYEKFSPALQNLFSSGVAHHPKKI